MSGSTDTNTSHVLEDTPQVDFATNDGPGEIENNNPIDFTINDVPDEIQDIRLVGLLYIEILKAGDMMSTGDPVQDRANAKKIKNHVAYWAYIHPADATGKGRTIRFSMNVMNLDASFDSTDARYVPSDRSSHPSLDSAFSASGRPTSSVCESPSDDAAPSVHRPVAMFPEGIPAEGRFDIKVRNYAGKSHSAVAYFALRIIAELKLRDILNSLRDRQMLPFLFRNIPFLNSSEAIEAWKQDEYIMDTCMRMGSLFRNIIGFRYTTLKHLPADPLASSSGEGSEDRREDESSGDESDEGEVIDSMRKTPDPIDKGIFPEGFQSLTDEYHFAD